MWYIHTVYHNYAHTNHEVTPEGDGVVRGSSKNGQVEDLVLWIQDPLQFSGLWSKVWRSHLLTAECSLGYETLDGVSKMTPTINASLWELKAANVLQNLSLAHFISLVQTLVPFAVLHYIIITSYHIHVHCALPPYHIQLLGRQSLAIDTGTNLFQQHQSIP